LRLSNEFTIAVPLEETWAALLDVPRVARALPGATIEPDGADGAYRGSMKVKLGPVTAEYAGTARLQDVDDDERVASFYVQGRERRGQGSAAATITSRVAAEGGGTHVLVQTELQITGRQAQLGAGIMEEVAGSLLREFSSRLEQELLGGGGARPTAEALDLGAAVVGPLSERALLVTAGVAVGLLLGRLVWRRS
jgi:carbon monoxide dehydrogenase subunit G